jgi:hypothetical protein
VPARSASAWASGTSRALGTEFGDVPQSMLIAKRRSRSRRPGSPGRQHCSSSVAAARPGVRSSHVALESTARRGLVSLRRP